MVSNWDGSGEAAAPSDSGYKPPIKLLGGVLWSLAGAMFVMLWRVGEFTDLHSQLLANAHAIEQVLAVLAVFFLGVPVIFLIRRRHTDTEIGSSQRTLDNQSAREMSSEKTHDAGEGSFDSLS